MKLPIEGLVCPNELQQTLGVKAKALRLYLGYKRVTLAKKCAISPETVRNFEQSGKITLENFIKIAFVLNESNKLGSMFDLPEITSISDIKKRQHKIPQRGYR